MTVSPHRKNRQPHHVVHMNHVLDIGGTRLRLRMTQQHKVCTAMALGSLRVNDARPVSGCTL